MQNIIHTKFMPAACVMAALVTSAASEASDITYETRALTGTDGTLGPGLGGGVEFSGFSDPVLNGAGRTLFIGALTGTGVDASNNAGVWSEGGESGLALIARRGSQATGTTAGVNFNNFSELSLNSAGQAAFRCTLTGAGVTGFNSDGIWSEGGGAGLALVARRGNQAPGVAAGLNYAGVSSPVLNDAGKTAFSGSLIGTGVNDTNNGAIWSEGGGSGVALVAREGDNAPGTAAGVNFSSTSFNFAGTMLNGAGQTAFLGTLSGVGVDSTNNQGIWSEGGGSGLALVARGGRQAPGTPAGVNFTTLSAPRLNGAGQTAFSGRLTGPGLTISNDAGIWSEGGGSGLALVARSGNSAPGAPAGVNFSGFSPPVINGAGHTAFRGALTGSGVTTSNDSGIWSEGGGSGLSLVAREGDNAPGTAADVVFTELPLTTVLNSAGQTAFVGSLTTFLGVDPTSDRGIWATDTSGQLHLIAREGDLFNVGNDPQNPDPRTISALSLLTGSGGEDGRGTSFNAVGQLSFLASFTDGSSGIFVATFANPTATSFRLTITRATAPASGYDFEWDSQPGKVYDLVTSPDLATPVSEWPVYHSYADIPATGTTTTLTGVPGNEPKRFFAVVERDAPLSD